MTQDIDPSREPGPAKLDPEAELQAFGRAGERSAQVIRQAIASGEQGAFGPLEAVMALEDVMNDLRSLLATVPELLIAARPGPAVIADMQARAEELAALVEQVDAASSDLESIKATE